MADAPILLRKATGAYTLNIDDKSVLTINPNANNNVQVLITTEDFEATAAATAKTGTITINGTPYTVLAKDFYESNTTYYITGVDGLKYFRDSVNNGASYSGKTVYLKSDIDLNNEPWTPIGLCNSKAYFQGIFDGQDHVIKNLYVDYSTDEYKYSTAGLFGWVDQATATVKNVKVDHATVKGSHWVGVIAGFWSGEILNCTVTNSTVIGYKVNDDANGDKIGGIVGYMNATAGKLDSNTVSNTTITGYRDVAGIAGAVAVANTVINNKVEKVVITYSADYADKIVSPKTAVTIDATNTATDVTIIKSTTIDSNESLEDELTANLEHIVVNLTSDVTYDVNAWKADAMGGAITKTVTINGNGHTITFHHTNSDWNHIVTNGAKLIINNAKITNSGYNNGPWNRHDISFACEVELNNVTSDKALAFKAGATLNTVTIDDKNTSDTYAIWIQPNGQTVKIDGLTVAMKDCTDGRGIKIDNQYNENSEKMVTLIVKNATFHTEEKAAIIVKSAVGADIQLENVNIADTIDPAHEVWVDEDSKEYYDLVTVTGGTKICEANVVANATELKAAVVAGITDLYLLAGEYDVNGCGGKTLTINGTKAVVLKLYNEGESGCDYGFGSAAGVGNVTFNNVTIDTTANTGSYKGYAYMQGTYNNCAFVGEYATVNSYDHVFNNCEFNFGNGYIWTWGAKSVTFNKCVFNGTSKAILAHGSGNTVINVNECTFAATAKGYASGNVWTSAIEIDPNPDTCKYTINITKSTINENYAGWVRIKDASTGHSIKIDGAYLVLDETMFKAAINSGEEEIEIILAKDISVDIGTGWKMGTEATKSISIKGITKTVTLNLSNTYRSYFNMANPDGKLYLSDLVLTNAHAGTHFFDYTTHFNCDLVAENVTFAKSPLVDSGVTAQFTNCNFSQAGTDIYGLWIMSGSNVTVIGGELTTDRGFKIADEDSAKELTKLTVSGTKFNNSKKAAILVTTAYGAEITLNGLDITNCGADSTNAVWIDDGRTANEDTVVVTGGTVIIEP